MARNTVATMSSASQQAGGQAGQGGLSELWKRLRFLLMALAVYRIGSYIPIPGIHPERLAELFESSQGTVVDLFNVFSGGALERMSIFALNIFPYITAAIILQLLSAVHPPLAKLRKEGEAGRRVITQYTRYLTVVIAILHAVSVAVGLQSADLAVAPGPGFLVTASVSMVTGTIFLMWVGEQISERGIGNGISILIFTSIVASLPAAIGQSIEQARQGDLNPLILLAIGLGSVAVIAAVVFFERGQRRLTVQHPRRQVGRQMSMPQSSHLPLKINMSGVIPAIFATALLAFPASIALWADREGGVDLLQRVVLALQPPSPLYLLLFAGLIIFFCFFYTALVFNPNEVSDNLKKSGAYFPGIRPGRSSADYIDRVLTRLTVYGALYMVAICLLPLMLAEATGVPFQFGGTSLLIVVVVAMDFMSQLQTHMMSHQYASLMRRSGMSGVGRAGGR